MKRVAAVFGVLGYLVAGPVLAQETSMPGMSMPGMEHHHHHDTPDPAEKMGPEKLGKVSFPTSCRATDEMEHGVALLHSFGYVKAQVQFMNIAAQDSSCAMAHWGVAMTQYQELWGLPEPEMMHLGADEMAKARALAANATPREQAYIAALSAFFEPVSATFQQRADAYTAKMDALYAAYPDDVEAGAFDALATLADTPPGDTSLSHSRRALAILQPLFAANPEHPGLAHYIIHTCDTPALAQQGLAAARVYARIAPASPHALHMPAHIFARLGMWQEDIASNEASVAASHTAENAHQPGAAHQMHADEFLIYAYLQTGQDAKAQKMTAAMSGIGDRMAAMPGMDDMKSGGHFFDNELRVVTAMELHQWTTLAALAPAKGTSSYEDYTIWWGRGVAAGHLHDAKLAADALAGLDRSIAAMKASPYAAYVDSMTVIRDEILAWQAWARARPDDAVTALRRAADQQDKLGQAEVDIPAREMLGDLLLMEHRPTEALAEYRVALKLSPNRLNGLLGAGAAAAQAGQAADAKAFYTAAANQTHFTGTRPALIAAIAAAKAN